MKPSYGKKSKRIYTQLLKMVTLDGETTSDLNFYLYVYSKF